VKRKKQRKCHTLKFAVAIQKRWGGGGGGGVWGGEEKPDIQQSEGEIKRRVMKRCLEGKGKCNYSNTKKTRAGTCSLKISVGKRINRHEQKNQQKRKDQKKISAGSRLSEERGGQKEKGARFSHSFKTPGLTEDTRKTDSRTKYIKEGG